MQPLDAPHWQAATALDTPAAAGEESVDRAFLELEHAHALRRLGRHGAADAACTRAVALAAAFGDASLTDGYRSRVERQRQLPSD